MKRKRRRSEKVSKMGGSESKATVSECMIKNLKKGLGGDYGVKMRPNCLHILLKSHLGSFVSSGPNHFMVAAGDLQM